MATNLLVADAQGAHVVKNGNTMICSDYVLWHGFVYIKDVGLIRTKDYLFVWLTSIVPRSRLSKYRWSIVYWPLDEQNHALPAVRRYAGRNMNVSFFAVAVKNIDIA